jgi:hypothetical protein
MVGTDGKTVGGFGLLFLYFGMAVNMVVRKGGTAVVGLALAFPVILFGLWAHLIGIVIIAVIITIVAVIALILMFVTRT